MEDGLSDILDQCLARLEQGATVEECLAAFPGQHAELELSLRVAAQVRALPRPAMPAATRAALETQMLAAAASRRAAWAPNGSHRPAVAAGRSPRRRLDPAALLAGLLGAIGYRGASGQPWLRPAALAATLLLALALSAGALAAARAIVGTARPAPTATATALPTSRQATAAIEGTIERLAQERWVVGGRIVLVGPETAIEGTPAVGAAARISGMLGSDGVLTAARVVVTARPSATATPVPTAPPTATGAAAPAVVPQPSAMPEPPAEPTPDAAPVAPTRKPAAPAAPGGQPQEGGATPASDDQQCQGQQVGRDDKKCDPKPLPEPQDSKPTPKPEQPKPEQPKPKPDKPKDGGGKPGKK